MPIVPPVSVPVASFGPLCAATGLCWNSPGTGIMSILTYLTDIVVPAIKVIFIGVGVLYAAWYAMMLLVGGSDDSVQKQHRSAFSAAAQGMAVMGVAVAIVQMFAPSAVGNALVDVSPFTVAVDRVVDFITMATGAFLVFIISYSGLRLIVLQGNESEIETQRKNFFSGLLGVVLLLLARVIVQALLPSGTPLLLVAEAGGMIRFLLEIIAVLAVLSFLVSGVLFLVALHNDTLRQRARRILLSTIIILLIVVFSHLLVSTFIPAGLPPTTI